MAGTVHARWCDGFHVTIGTPECSALVGQVAGGAVMLFGNAQRSTPALVGVEGDPLGTQVAAVLAAAAQLAA